MELSINGTINYSSLETGVIIAKRYCGYHYRRGFAIEY